MQYRWAFIESTHIISLPLYFSAFRQHTLTLRAGFVLASIHSSLLLSLFAPLDGCRDAFHFARSLRPPRRQTAFKLAARSRPEARTRYDYRFIFTIIFFYSVTGAYQPITTAH